ncbi:MAG: hypothetical protein JOZ10_06275 [Acidobacteria bacterium]|nr:hypothetical protein [Acidobacteriota bacterium]MBV9145785.1 hypothetical protein [Acidobacteriota bacterium]MBV9435336.1 hypothetical protein [Acidobacteriota bacterium]
MMKRAVPLWAILVFAASAFAATTSHEETVVRHTYAKLAYAANVESVWRVVDEQGEHMNVANAMREIDEQKLQFNLSDFKVGYIKDIQGFYTDYVAVAGVGEVLSVGPSTNTTTEDGELVRVSLTGTAQWAMGTDGISAASKFPAVSILSRAIDGITYERYAAYRVHVKFEGKQRDYRALAVFAPAKPGSGTVLTTENEIEDVLFVDFITGNSALTYFCKESNDVSPTRLLDFPSNPIVERWLRENPPLSRK